MWELIVFAWSTDLFVMVSITEDILQVSHISEAEIRQEIAVLLYQRGLSLMKAADFARMDRIAFQHFLASRHIPIDLTIEDYEQDVRTLAWPKA